MAKMKFHAFIMYKPDPMGVPFLGIFIGGTNREDGKLAIPPGAQSLTLSGGRKTGTRVEMIDEAIRYLMAERQVAEEDALKRTSTPLVLRSQ